jgi:hypothetical protein
VIYFRKADEKDLAAAASVLTAAFAEHEVYRKKFRPLFGSSQSYVDFLNRLHAVMVKVAMRHHICLLAEEDGRLLAVATIHKLGCHPVSTLSFLWAGAWRMWKYISQLLVFQKVFGEGSKEAKRIGVRSLYLELLGVMPDCQGKGVGGLFIAEGLEALAKEEKSQRLTLITHTESNCRFYKKNGFRQLDVRDVEGVRTWTFEKPLADIGTL